GRVTPLELGNASTTLAADGNYAPPVFIVSVGTETTPAVAATPVLRPEIAFLDTSMMQSVVEEGTGTGAKKLKRPIAGKTGTSNDARDAWFIGFTPDLVAGVWVGFDDHRRLGHGEQGAKAAVPIFTDFMKPALKGKSARGFKQPSGIVTVRIDKKTGKLAAPGEAEADTMDEVFLE